MGRWSGREGVAGLRECIEPYGVDWRDEEFRTHAKFEAGISVAGEG